MSFLISFMVDARGGAMRGRRHSGVRIIIPPRKASMPTRVTCRLIKKDKLMHPIPLNEGEALAARILEMGPVATKFLGRIVIEIPHFASLRGKEREIKILRSDNGEKWEEHPILATDDAVNKALNESLEDLEHEDDLANKRITRILTDDFPRYFALVTRVREERQSVGEEGGVISSTVVPQVQAVFPEGALTKKIRVGLQAQPISPDLVAKLLGNRVAVSPIVTVEPRRRKFHKTITLTIPVPKAQQKGMINPHRDDLPSLRVLYSISEGTDVAIWDDLTDQTQLKLVNDCVSFTTRVSGRFWLMDCQNYTDATRMATELYREAVVVPYMARFVVFAKRTGEQEGKLRMFCMTDDKIDKTLEKQEHFVEVARSRDVEVLEGRQQFVEMAGNLIPITKSGDQLYVDFKAFRENRLPCTVRIRDLDQEPAARVAFMKEPKVARGEVPQTPICNLNISLPDMSTSSSMEMDGDAALELRKRSSLLKEYGIVIEDTVSRAQIKLTDVADTLKGDWVVLAQQLDFTSGEINQIKNDYNTVNDQALAMLQLWAAKDKEQATGNALEKALTRINREDVVKKCMYNVETVEDEVEAAAARVAMDQSGFDTFTEEVGISRDSSMKRGMSLDVQYDEQDIIKESESVAEESGSDVGSVEERSAPQAREEDTEQGDDDQIISEVDSRRGVAKEDIKHESNQEDFFDLISQLDKYAEVKDKRQTKDQEQVAPDSAAIEALAESLSFGEPPKEEAPQPEETVSPYSESVSHQMVTEAVQADVASEQEVMPVTQGSEFTAPPLDEDVVDVQFEFLEEEINKSSIETEQYVAGNLGTDIPAVQSDLSSSVDPEPDMGRVVECLKKDLVKEASPPEPKRSRSSSLSSSSFSSSSHSLPDHHVEEDVPSEPSQYKEVPSGEDRFVQDSPKETAVEESELKSGVMELVTEGEKETSPMESNMDSFDDAGGVIGTVPAQETVQETNIDDSVPETTPVQETCIDDVVETKPVQESYVDNVVETTPVQESYVDNVVETTPVQESSVDDVVETTPVQDSSVDDVVETTPVQESSVDDFIETKPVQETSIDTVPGPEPVTQETTIDDCFDSLTSASSADQQIYSSKESDLDDILEQNIGHLHPTEIASGIKEPEGVEKYESGEEDDKLSSSSSSSSHSSSSGEHDLQQPSDVRVQSPLADIEEHVEESVKEEPVVTPGSGSDSAELVSAQQKDAEPDHEEAIEEFESQSSSSHTTYSSGDDLSLPSDSEDFKAMGEDYVDRGEQYEVMEDRASMERTLSGKVQTGTQEPIVEDVTTKDKTPHEECQPGSDDLDIDEQALAVEVLSKKVESSVTECQPAIEDLEEDEQGKVSVEKITTKIESTVQECQPAIEDLEHDTEPMEESFVDREEQYEASGDRASVERVITETQSEVEGEPKHTKHVAFEESTTTETTTTWESQESAAEGKEELTKGESGVVVQERESVEESCPPTEEGAANKKEGSPLEWRYPGDSEEGEAEGEGICLA